MKRKRILDGCCKAGGAGKGYGDAGFEVLGVDNEPQPNYPYEFVKADILEVLADRAFMARFDAVHVSPPCRDHTPLTSVAGTDGTGWLLAACRKRLEHLDVPWVIENVPGAPMRPDLVLCGHMFKPRLRTRRHRWFELGPLAGIIPPLPHRHATGVRTATRNRRQRWAQGWDVSITGDVGVYVGPEALGIDWMSGDELSNAIPPAYTRYIGEYLLEALNAREAA